MRVMVLVKASEESEAGAMPSEQILAANKAIKNPNKIAPGDVIVIPTPAPSDVVDGGASSSP